MNEFNDATALVSHAEKALLQVREEYESSLASKNVSASLLVEIKNLMENLRSALDFCAGGLFAMHGNARPNAKTYFPYATRGQDLAEFRRQNRIERCIPGITASRPDIVAILESFQHFVGPKWAWMPRFMELNNENKHQRLTPQTRRERKQLDISAGGARISLGEGASINLGTGASIRMGGAVVPGDQQISVNQPGRVYGAKQELITWVSFHFSTNDEPVLPLLEQAVRGTREIVERLASL